MNKEILLAIGQLLDVMTDLFIKISGIVFIIQGCYLSACICFGMSALWSMCCFGIKKFPMELLNKQ